ncbi:MAG: hypothetical protein KK482_28135 [Sinorhizobium meliloti]|nr:hypothetical protein [Sinorhizobium meliloti]
MLKSANFFADSKKGVDALRQQHELVDVTRDGRLLTGAQEQNTWATCRRSSYWFASDGDPLIYTASGAQVSVKEDEFLQLYGECGIDVFSRLDGQFAIALYDSTTGRLFLARDAFGSKPLYVAAGAEHWAFSSRIHELLRYREFTGYAYDSIDYFLREGWCPPGSTFLTGIRPTRAGFVEYFGAGSTGCLRMTPDPRTFSEPSSRQPASELLAILRNAVVDAIPSRVSRIGVSLSGGIDSAAIVAIISDAAPEVKIETFTVGFGEGDPEIQGARKTAEHFKTSHHEVFVHPEQLETLVEDTTALLGNPGGYDELPCLNALWRVAAQRIDVLFSGNLNDALFGGMSTHRRVWNRKLLRQWFPGAAGRIDKGDGYHFVANGKIGPAKTLRDGGNVGEYVHWVAYAETIFEALQRDLLSWDERTSAQDVLASGIGLDLRLPLNRRALISFALSVPDAQKVSLLDAKRIFREAVAPIVPASITRRRKGIQHLKYDEAMRRTLLSLANRYLSDGAVRRRGVLDPNSVGALVEAVQRKLDATSFRFLWNAILFEAWCRVLVDA